MNIKKICRFIEDVHPSVQEVNLGLLFARIAVAVFFITHGYSKLIGIEGFSSMLAEGGFPMPVLFAWLVAIAEFFGGVGILVGIGTRFSAFWLTVISFVAWATVKGFSLGMDGGDIDILALGLTLLLLKTGPGAFSVSAKINKGNI